MTSAISSEATYGDVSRGNEHFGGERRHRVSWGALFAGAVVALASWILLYAVGLAIGLSSVDPADLSSAKVAGIGTGIYSILAPLIALFCGGVVASRLAGIRSHKDGALHGVVVWGLTTIAGLFVIGTLLSNIVAGIVGIGKDAVSTAAAATATSATATDGADASTGGTLAALGLDYDALLAPVNRRLAADALPAITIEQVKAAVQSAVPAMVASGSFNKEALIGAIAANTAMTRAEAEGVAAEVQAKLAATTDSVAATAKTTALRAADTTGKAFWAISAALLLGLASAAAGGAIGTPSAKRRRSDVVVPRHVTLGGPA